MFTTHRIIASRTLSRQLVAPRIAASQFIRPYSDAATKPTHWAREPKPADFEPESLVKIKQDLKKAEEAGDTRRVAIAESIITIANSHRRPWNRIINPDRVMLGVLNRALKEGQTAIKYYGLAERQDLVDTEEQNVAILSEYTKYIEVLSKEELTNIVEERARHIKSTGKPLFFTPLQRAAGATINFRQKAFYFPDLCEVVAAKLVQEKGPEAAPSAEEIANAEDAAERS